ncbi:MAG TPA: RNase H family protein [Pirellulales bacterium]|nr:RNase H family protein [Pirellulales bacterium]
MNIPAPHFLLFSEARRKNRQGLWRFVLQAADGSATFEASDTEPHIGGERLELLAVIRGLEYLDQPSRVTLFTPSKYVSRGMAYGLDEWRRTGWTWESFGEMVPVKNRDLWQRLDRALGFHTIEFRITRIDQPHAIGEPALVAPPEAKFDRADLDRSLQPPRNARRGRLWAARASRSFRQRLEGWKLGCSQLGTSLLPKPWIG